MTPKRKKIMIWTASCLLGGLLIFLGGSFLILQTQWFADLLRAKAIAVLEDSTGGRVEIKSFRFDPAHLTLRIENLVLHGSEPSNAKPLASAALLELRLKLLSGFSQMIDLDYLGVEQPSINLIVNPDGSTNVPSPKLKSAPSSKSSFATIVDLAVGKFLIQRGSLSYAQKVTPFSMQGDNLHVLLNFNALSQSYAGNVNIAPLFITREKEPTLRVSIDLPIRIDRNGLKLRNARFITFASQLNLDASLDDLNAPKVSAKAHAKLSLQDLQSTLNPGFVIADLDAHFDQAAKILSLRTLHLDLGASQLNASGNLNPATNETVQFKGNLVLAELTRLLNVTSPSVAGSLQISGAADLDGQRNYKVSGSLETRGFALTDGSMHFSNVSLTTPFLATPDEISLNPIRLTALDGSFSGRILLQQMRQLSAQGDFHDISLTALASAFAGHPIRYAGAISGSVNAKTDLQAKGNSDLLADAHLTISPRTNGVPISGRLEAQYAAATSQIKVTNSTVSFPNSRLTLAGSPNRDLQVSLISRNLNDFLPIANFGAKKPVAELPFKLNGGALNLEMHVQGDLANPRVAARAVMNHFVAQKSQFDKLSFDLVASQSAVNIQNGSLSQTSLKSTFNAALGLVHWQPVGRSPLSANLTVNDAGLDALLALANQSNIQAAGLVNADLHIKGTYGDPLGAGTFRIQNGTIEGQPFDALNAQINAIEGLISLSNFDVSTAGGHLTALAFLHHPLDNIAAGHLDLHLNSNGIDLSKVLPLQRNNVHAAGSINLTADASAMLTKNSAKEMAVDILKIDANLSATSLSVRNHPSGNFTATAHTADGIVQYNLKSNFAGSNIALDGRTSLAAGYRTEANAGISALPLKDALDVAGYSNVPVTGNLTTQLSFVGTTDTPDLKANLELSAAKIYEEPISKLTADLRYTNTLAEITSFNLHAPAGTVSLSGRYDHPNETPKGTLQLKVRGNDLQMAKLRQLQNIEPGLSGTVNLDADLAGTVIKANGSPSVLLSALNANLAAQGLRAANQNLGTLTASAHTSQAKVRFELESDLAQSKIHASGESQLVAGYPTRAGVTFANIRFRNIAPFLSNDSATAPSFDALVEGQASVNGPLTDVTALQAKLEVNRLDVQAATRTTLSDALARSAARLQNDGPLVVSLDKSQLKIEQFKIRGPKTSLEVSGAANLANSAGGLQISLKASSDLGILQDFSQNFFSSGNIAVDATVGGSLTQPVMNGKIELHQANLNYADVPNGLSNGEGVILLNGKTATIQNLTGESGGGKISVDGFVGLSPTALIYNLRATAAKVRSRYGSVSIVSSANVQLTGSSRRSLLSGKVSVQKVAYSSSSDIGSMLTSAAAPPATESASSPLLSNMRLDIDVSTASDIRVVTSFVEKIDLNSSLHVRGTAADPGILGRINISDGQLTFFGNSYTINKGAINFYDASAVKPELNLSLETVAQGVDVVLGVTGPINDMKLNYRSDPPLTFEQIVQLLATNTTPFDPTIAAHQPAAPTQSMSQMGESAILGQAIANPLASRVQRVFGLSQFKIDPSVAGNNGQPTARVTLQQKIASNITFTYITDVTQSNSEIVRIQWDLGPKVSAVALRDYNGNVSVEMFYKFQVR